MEKSYTYAIATYNMMLQYSKNPITHAGILVWENTMEGNTFIGIWTKQIIKGNKNAAIQHAIKTAEKSIGAILEEEK
jgi:hypothetical protein